MENNIDSNLRRDNRFEEMSPEIREQAIAIIKEEIPDTVKEKVLASIAQNGPDWIHIEMAHFGWGMAIRNLLRSRGIKDEALPSGNWDDYYIPVVEAAVGARTLKV